MYRICKIIYLNTFDIEEKIINNTRNTLNLYAFMDENSKDNYFKPIINTTGPHRKSELMVHIFRIIT